MISCELVSKGAMEANGKQTPKKTGPISETLPFGNGELLPRSSKGECSLGHNVVCELFRAH